MVNDFFENISSEKNMFDIAHAFENFKYFLKQISKFFYQICSSQNAASPS